MGFAERLRALMAERGLSGLAVARKVHCDQAYISRLASGRQRPSQKIARLLDDALDAAGELAELAERDRAGRQRQVSADTSRPSRVLEALKVVTFGDTADLDTTIESLAGLVFHYNHVVSVNPSTAVYDELLSVRSFADSLLGQGRRTGGRRSDLVVMAGWFSGLLAILATDAGDHAAASVWCSDMERRGRDAGHPDLLGWAAVTRSLIAYYHGQAHRSAAIACHGREIVPLGTIAHARLAAQEMRSQAMLGDADGMAAARRRAVTAIESLGPDAAAVTGAFSIPLDEDPPYTATSLLLVGRCRNAAEVTRRVITGVYHGNPGDWPAKYARTLLILGLAEAGLGQLEEASAAGSAALECSRPAWPTMVLAERLDRSLAKRSTSYTADYHARYIDAARRLPSRQLTAGTGRSGER